MVDALVTTALHTHAICLGLWIVGPLVFLQLNLSSNEGSQLAEHAGEAVSNIFSGVLGGLSDSPGHGDTGLLLELGKLLQLVWVHVEALVDE
jgi:hypothetical protein